MLYMSRARLPPLFFDVRLPRAMRARWRHAVDGSIAIAAAVVDVDAARRY